METKEYFEKVMQDYSQNRKGRNLRKYYSDEGIDKNGYVIYLKWFDDGKMLKPNTLRMALPAWKMGIRIIEQCLHVTM